MKRQHLFAGYAAILFAMLFWGVSFVWTKQLLNWHFPVFTIVLFRLIISAVVLFTFFTWQHKLEKIRKGDRKRFLLLAFFEPFLYFIGEDFGLQYVEASFAAVIIALMPIVVALALHFAEGEPLRWELLAGIVVSVIGIILIGMGPGHTFAFNLKGLLLLFLALAAGGGYSIFLSKLLKNYSPITITTWQNILAIPFYLPFVLIFDLSSYLTLIWSLNAVVCLFCLAIFCSSGAYILFSYAAKKISIAKVTVFSNAIPIATILFAVLLGQETVTPLKFAGICIVVIGVIVSQLKLKRS